LLEHVGKVAHGIEHKPLSHEASGEHAALDQILKVIPR
jgi:hypothetical protein